MKIPKKLKICGLDYTIVLLKDLHLDEGLAGQHDGDKQIIRLQNRGYHSQAIEQNFFHEVTHAINSNYLNGKLDEDIVDSISNGIYQVLKDNRLLR